MNINIKIANGIVLKNKLTWVLCCLKRKILSLWSGHDAHTVIRYDLFLSVAILAQVSHALRERVYWIPALSVVIARMANKANRSLYRDTPEAFKVILQPTIDLKGKRFLKYDENPNPQKAKSDVHCVMPFNLLETLICELSALYTFMKKSEKIPC